ncbi:hypothetical protein [Clostridium formicaceticum]|uniref:Uncharacterized protein n=1 Tax=Clostridium formicaceticum TaxID=1497 RepID=A0AAC9RL07_9CLOT|nr:hypothetical protein [Clostridium formicaceticum]ARE87941.1 hypothetical protein CLFO_23410 [Clostridium formicaceticum]
MTKKESCEKKLTIQEMKQRQNQYIYEAILNIIEFSLLLGCLFGLLMLLFEI